MAIAIGHVDRVLTAVIDRTSELLHTRAWAVDEHDTIIASSGRDDLGMPLHAVAGEALDWLLRVPVDISGRASAVLVVELTSEAASARSLAQTLVELIVSQVRLVADMPNQREVKNQFVYKLIFGTGSDEAAMLREGQILGIDLTLPRAVILIDASAHILADVPRQMEIGEAQMQRRVSRVVQTVVSFFHLPNDTICAYLGGGEIAILKASTTRDLMAWTDQETPEHQDQTLSSWTNLAALKRAGNALLQRLRHELSVPISIGIGRYHPGIRGLAASYADARAALLLGRHFHGHNQLHCLDALGIAAFIGVSDERTKIDLARHLLSPLDHEPELLDTLAVFFSDDRSFQSAANQLAIHRNTLNYRLDKITSLTGLDPRRFDDAVQIRLALLLRSMQSEPSYCANAQ